MRKILGAQLYTLREFAKTPKEIEQTFKKVREIGYTTVQASGIGQIEASELRAIADATGIKIIIT
ncbi:MAG: sugar phosphate isomerase/epimerase, partial [Hyphomonadaceae bacterium]|nr:sugar phosphate isomerase/epimerase [Clostridia bacterium]